jgi:GTP cyclohydrolase I
MTKNVTEAAYDNPKFVEDVVRDLAVTFRQHKDIKGFMVQAEAFESIHDHNAFGAHQECFETI